MGVHCDLHTPLFAHIVCYVILYSQQEQARSFVEGTSAEQAMAVVIPEKTKTDKPISHAGVSFRKKFEDAKRKKYLQVDEHNPREQEKPVDVPPPPIVEEAPAPKPKAVAPPPVEEAPAPVEPPKAVVTPPKESSAAQESPAAVGETNEEMRSQLRTLMGLVLKHRGGPGFGAGRLKGSEAERFESLLKDVSNTLRSEAGIPEAAVEEPIAATPKAKAPEPAVTAPISSTEDDPLAGTMDCVEAVTAMYRRSPPEEKEGVLVSVRAALMDAVNKCNKAIAENEMANKQAYDADVRGSMGFPDTYEIAKPEEDVAPAEPTTAKPAPAAPAPVASDSNTQLFADIYKKLEASSGDGQFGLKEGMTPDEVRQETHGAILTL